MAGLFERHDRERFEATAISLGTDAPSAMRSRLQHAFARFVDVGRRSDREAADLPRSMEVDIAVDLNGHTADARTGITGVSRVDAGLPVRGLVFCSFSNNYKITPPVFYVWMRLLRRIEGSVLWLPGGNAAVEANLRREASVRGIAPPAWSSRRGCPTRSI
jgi:predicted O-linked N-acetylglucosamine transferase (SPINDLY family)